MLHFKNANKCIPISPVRDMSEMILSGGLPLPRRPGSSVELVRQSIRLAVDYTYSYFVFRACTGSSFEARSAGTRQANPATNSRVAVTEKKTAGSRGSVSYNMDRMRR